MPNDTIRAALDAAEADFRQSRDDAMTYCPCAWAPKPTKLDQGVARGIAAFHTHLAADAKRIGTARALEEAFRHESLAALVEEAARHE